MYKNRRAEHGEQFRTNIQITTLDPLQRGEAATTLSLGLFQGRHQRPRDFPHRHARGRRSRCGASPRPARHPESPRTHRRPPLPRSAISCAPHTRKLTPRANKNASVRPSWQMRCISVSKSPTTAPSKYARSSTKTHPPKANTWPHTSLNAYQPAPSPKSPDWARPYASGRTHSTPTSTQAEPATHPTEAINGHYRTRQTHRQRLPQPHQLPTPHAPHHRRPRHLPHTQL